MSPDQPTSKLQAISSAVDSRIRNSFGSLGRAVARQPYAFILATLIFTAGCGVAWMMLFQQELDGEDLYTPPGAQSFKDRDFVLNAFGSPGQLVRVMVTKDVDFNQEKDCRKRDLLRNNSDARTVLAAYQDLFDLIENQSIESEGNVLKLADVCHKPHESIADCEVMSILGIWNYSRSALEADEDLLASIDHAVEEDTITSYLGIPVPSSFILGRGKKQGRCPGSVEVFQMMLFLKDNKVTINGLTKDHESRAWNKKLLETVESSWNAHGLAGHVLNYDAVDFESETAIDRDIGKLMAGYVLIFIFSHMVLFKNSPVFCKAHLASGCMISVVMAVITAFGLAQVIGVHFNLVVQSLPFLLLGLGMDDAFVIMGAYHSTSTDSSIEERMAETMMLAGSSIFVTSATDAMAFAVGAYTKLPALHDFAVYALLGIIFDFFYQVTFFAALVVLDAKREERARNGAPFWGFQFFSHASQEETLSSLRQPTPLESSGTTVGMSEDASVTRNWRRKIFGAGEFDPQEPSLSTRIAGVWIPKFCLHPIGYAVVGIIELSILAAAIYGCTKVKMDFRYRDWFVPDGSYLKAAFHLDSTYFYGEQVYVTVFTKEPTDGLNFFSHLGEYEDMLSALKQGQYVSDVPPVVSWYDAYLKWLALESPFLNELNELGRAPNATTFIQWVQAFLDEPAGAYFRDSVIIGENGIGITKLECYTKHIKDGSFAIATLDDIRSLLKESAPAFEPGAYSDHFLFIDGFKLITWETIRNVIMAGLVVFVLTTIVLADAVASSIVTLMIALTDVMLFGFMWYAGLTFNTVTSINMVLAVGIAVDYCAHIAHSFLVCQGSLRERAQAALNSIGGEVIAGACTTWLAIAPMGFAEHYIFRTFFKMFSAIVVTGAWHGLVVLPIVLSRIGPRPYANHEA